MQKIINKKETLTIAVKSTRVFNFLLLAFFGRFSINHQFFMKVTNKIEAKKSWFLKYLKNNLIY